jgi:CRISPR/Cas system-associated exonuclease Cas4 (RecB family)
MLVKVRVLQTFRDKHTREIHKIDKEMEISQERFEEILTVGELVEEIKEDQKPTPKKQAKKTTKKDSK